jgi:hypothetical protein
MFVNNKYKIPAPGIKPERSAVLAQFTDLGYSSLKILPVGGFFELLFYALQPDQQYLRLSIFHRKTHQITALFFYMTVFQYIKYMKKVFVKVSYEFIVHRYTFTNKKNIMKTPGRFKVSIACKIEDKQKAQLQSLAEKSNTTLSAITRNLINSFISEQIQKPEITVKELPKNNSKYKPIVFGSKVVG